MERASDRPGAKDDVDRQVGARILERRVALGLTQQQLGERIGVSGQQANKYERGIDRVSAGRLFDIARTLEVPVGFFFAGAGDRAEEVGRRRRLAADLFRALGRASGEEVWDALHGLEPVALVQLAEALVTAQRPPAARRGRAPSLSLVAAQTA